MENIEELKQKWTAEIKSATTLPQLEEMRVSLLGKKGQITEMMKNLGSLSVEEKKEMGKGLNILKSAVEQTLNEQREMLAAAELNARLSSEKIDVTLPIRNEVQGRIHPVSQIYEEVVAIFFAYLRHKKLKFLDVALAPKTLVVVQLKVNRLFYRST